MRSDRDPRCAAALVAAGLVVPGAEDPDTLWENIVRNRTFFRPAESTDFGAEPSLFYHPGEPAPDKAYSLSGAWSSGRREDFGNLKLPASFDPKQADLSLLWWLQAARRALDGNLLAAHEPAAIGVIAGHVILPTRTMAETAVSFYGGEASRAWEFNPFDPPPTTNHFRAVGYSAKLVAETFGFGGPAFTVDAACASSLYALKLAFDRLREGSLTAVVTGGLAQADPLFTQLGFSQLRALSRAGICRPFSEESDGLVVGSGAVALVLKRLDRAMADGDQIICVVSGVGLSNDRTGNLLAPNTEGQVRAMKNAFADAGLDPQIPPDLFEAHGTATPLGDAVEIAAIKTLLSGSESAVPPVVGSVKGNLGHLLSAAGAISLVKTAWAIKNQILPPTAGFSRASSELALKKAPALRILTSAAPWPAPPDGRPRLAAVNAFGFGGVNAQVLLEEFKPEVWSAPLSVKKPVSAKAGPQKTAPLSPADSSQETSGTEKNNPKNIKSSKAAKPAKNTAEPESLAGVHSGAAKTVNGKCLSIPQSAPLSASLISARTVLAPWPSYDTLARYWLTPEEPPLALTRRVGGLKATGFFFEQNLTLDVRPFHLPPKELAEALPQQTLALKPALAALNAAGISPDHWPEGLNRDRVGVFMGVDIDPRSADFALRWLAPPRAASAFIRRGLMSPLAGEELTRRMREGSPPPLTHNRVLGSLGSFVASRLARYLGIGGPSFTLSEEIDSGIRALREAMAFLSADLLDLALVGVVDTFGDPKTAALAPKTVWIEGAAALLLASPRAAKILQPLAELTLTDRDERMGPLSGLFALNRNAFYLRHHLKPLGRGHGFCYWLRNPTHPPRSLDGPGYVIVETPGARPQPLAVSPDSVKPDVWFYISAHSQENLNERLDALQNLLDQNPGRDLVLLARDFWNLFPDGKPYLAFLARDARELGSHIKRFLSGEVERDYKPRILTAPPEPVQGELAWVFPGSGNHYKGMGRGLATSFPEVMFPLESESQDPVGLFQSELLWEPNHKRLSVREAILGQVCFGLIGSKILSKMGIVPQAVLGYSLGEVSALVASGLWPERDELWRDLMSSTLFNGDLTGELNACRIHWNWPAHKPLKWLTALISRPAELVRTTLENLPAPHRHRAYLLLVNTHEEVVVGGEESSVQFLAQALEAPIFPIEDVAAVHAPVVGPVAEKYRLFHTRRVEPQPGLRFYSCHEARAIEPQSELVADSLIAQALEGHSFPALIEQAYADGVRFFIEIGPGSSTTRMIKSILVDRPHMAQSLAATTIDEGGTGLARVLAELWVSGYPLVRNHLSFDPPVGPDPRFEVPINLFPPQLSWPDPAAASQQEQTKTIPAAPTVSPPDYLAWLEQQTGKLGLRAASSDAGTSLAGSIDASGKIGSLPSPTPETADSVGSHAAETQAEPSGRPNRLDRPGPKTSASPLVSAAARADSSLASETHQGADSQSSEPPDDDLASPPPSLNRAQCLEFATGAIANVLGPCFAQVDTYPSRVRLPDEPLMFVDRVTKLEGRPNSLASGRIVTEHDIRADEWCVEGNRLTPGMSIESGQADLLLSAWLGIDSATKGLARYRLLDAEVVFHRNLPEAGQTAVYDIRLINFFSHADTRMFRFEFDGTVGGHPLLSMRRGCAGFFTHKALAAGKGLAKSAPDPVMAKVSMFASLNDFSGAFEVKNLSSSDLSALRSGDAAVLGPAFGRMKLDRPLLLPGGKLALIDRAPIIDPSGGAYGAGFIRTETDIDPKAWYLTSHFAGDEVMPGTLMYDACIQTLRLYLLAWGWLGESSQCSFQPTLGQPQSLKCRGQVTPKTKMVAYEVHVRETGLTASVNGSGGGEPYALAEAVMWADGRPIVEVTGLSLRLAGQTYDGLCTNWSVKKTRGRPKGNPATKPGLSTLQADPTAPDSPLKTGSVVRRQARSKPADDGSALNQADPEKQGKSGDYFDKARLTAMSTGVLSEALGPHYSRFDGGNFVARLPKAPYDFIDEATVRKGRPGQVVTGTQVEAFYRPSSEQTGARAWLLDTAGGQPPVLPYAAINEIALQSCGFLAAYMGSALSFTGPMHFRNLGGEANLRSSAPSLTSQFQTRATLIKASVLGSMTIQNYQFTCHCDKNLFYDGLANFGFHSSESLDRQMGLKATPSLLKALTSPAASGPSVPYPEGPAWPKGPLRMLDSLVLDPKGDGRIWGRVKIDPQAWFFEAHFPGDPVWPGSLGLEAFIQAGKVLWAQTYCPKVAFADISVSWAAPAPNTLHRWLYRGQIVPKNREVTLGLKVISNDPARRTLTMRGLLWVDKLVVYQIEDFVIGAATAAR